MTLSAQPAIALAVAVMLAAVTALAPQTGNAQRAWREFPGIEDRWYGSGEIRTGEQTSTEFVVGRLMFPQALRGYALGTGRGDWRRGGTAWTVDYPEGDRRFAELLARLTTIDVRAIEQPVNLDDDIDVYYWPFLISGLVGAWNLTDAQALKLRDYLLRGGFLLCDSFYGTVEWEGFVSGISRVFPDRPIVDLPNTHQIFHTVYDLSERPQIPTWQHLPHGYRNDGAEAHWRAILDDDGRVMVMIAFNNDIADGWQRADEYRYPAEAASLSIRVGVNFAVYALTH
ncbi:MAG TPA: DUF4159 domain-containing protein [Gammaproteobacteria bacterium]|nr:DUF4159 domain-containing protein [Gammaproteobacteria bacterium]